MNIQKDMCQNELRKVALLVTKACDLGMDLSGWSGEGDIGVNQSNGNVYLWNEGYPFSLYIDLGSDDIQACWSNFYNGDEEIVDATNMNLYQLEEWANNLTKEAERAEEVA